MATIRHDGTTRPLVQPDGLGGHRPEVIIHSGGGGGGGAVTIADGADVVEGSLADAAITSDAAGTVSGKLRGIVAILADVWDSLNNRLRVGIHDDGNSISVDDGGGSITVDGTVGVTGTVTVDQGTSPWVVSLADPVEVTQGTDPWTVDGEVVTTSVDGGHATLGATTDPDTADTVIGRLKQIITRLAGTLSVTFTNAVIAVTQSTSPWVVGDGGSSLSVDDGGGTITVDGTVTVEEPVEVEGTVTVEQGTDPWIVAGNKTHNAAPPGADNIGTLPAIATADDPTYTEGQQVGLSVGLDGKLRTNASSDGGSSTPTTTIDDEERVPVVDDINRRLLELILWEVMEMKRMMFEDNELE